MSEAGKVAPPPRGTKAGRNEQRKLIATFLNNAGVGFFWRLSSSPAWR